MARRNTTYQYRDGDDPLTVASQFGISPQQLLDANPGGFPFSVGQTVAIPFQYALPQPTIQYSAPIGPQPAPVVNPADDPRRGRGAGGPPTPTSYDVDLRGRGFNSVYDTGQATSNAGTPYMWGLGGGQTRFLPAGLNYQRQSDEAAAAASSTPNTAAGEFYGYERDPETGKSVRVVKNSGFLNELRWDPQAKKYVSIGSLLKQGKLDLAGNWHKQGRRQRQQQNRERKKKQQQQQNDFTLANSLISFGASSG